MNPDPSICRRPFIFIRRVKEIRIPTGGMNESMFRPEAEISIHSRVKEIKIPTGGHSTSINLGFERPIFIFIGGGNKDIQIPSSAPISAEMYGKRKENKGFPPFQVHSRPPASVSQRGLSPRTGRDSFIHGVKNKNFAGMTRGAPRSGPGADIHSFTW